MLITVRGEAAALFAAFLWAVSTVIFGRLGKQLPPLILNLVKGIVALALIGSTLALGQFAATGIDRRAITLLLLSGIIGIGLGDTAYFTALNHLGARRVLLLETLAPPLAALIAWLTLQEALGLTAWLGILLTLGGVGWVISEGVPGATVHTQQTLRGVGFGILAAVGQAAGAVLSRAALANTAVDPLWSSLLRLLGGLVMMAGILLWTSCHRPAASQPWQPAWRSLKTPPVWGGVAVGAFLGTYLAIWLQQMSLKYAPTGIAQSLTSTSPLFVLPIAALLGDRISLRALLGVLIALGGVWLLIGVR
ncbi:EamA family transporter [filamentous cyanobacterium CCP5]|nr:EamA family transporter [filamentous cyanobacterium CCP5]